MSEKVLYQWMLFLHDNEDVEPWIAQASEGAALSRLKKEYRKIRSLSAKTEIGHLRMTCNVDGCYEWASTVLEEKTPSINPIYRKEHSIRIGGQFVTCLCEKHHKRFTSDLMDRVFRLEERVDELVKVTEQMHELFEYRSDLD